jgi:drug/metabolite transporter (DMT)-like permease
VGEFFSIACAAVWALAVVLFRRSGETLPAFELNLFKNLLGTLLMAITLVVLGQTAMPAFTPAEWLIVLASGVIGIALADTWYLRALNLMGAARTGITASLFSPFVVILSAIFLGERLQGWQFAGFALVLAGIVLVTWRSQRIDVSARAIRLGVFFGAGAVLMMAVGIVMVKPILEGEHFFATAGLRLAAGSLAMLGFVTATRTWPTVIARYRQPQPWPTIVFASFLASYFAMLLWLGGYRLAPASIASVLNETAAAFIVLFAWWMLSEPLSLRRLAGLGLTFSGVVLILVV